MQLFRNKREIVHVGYRPGIPSCARRHRAKESHGIFAAFGSYVRSLGRDSGSLGF